MRFNVIGVGEVLWDLLAGGPQPEQCADDDYSPPCNRQTCKRWLLHGQECPRQT